MKYRYKHIVGLCGFICAGVMSFFPGTGWGATGDTANVTVANADNSVVLELDLKWVSIRGEHFTLYTQNENGEIIEKENIPEPDTYLGVVVDLPEFKDAIVWGTVLYTTDESGNRVPNFTGGILTGRGLSYGVKGNVIADEINGVDNEPFYDFPTQENLKPYEVIGRKLWSFEVAVDVQHKYLEKHGVLDDPFAALTYYERGLLGTTAVYIRDIKLLPKLGPIVLRTTETHCPYSALGGDSRAKFNEMEAFWSYTTAKYERNKEAALAAGKPINPIKAGEWDLLWAVVGGGSSRDRMFMAGDNASAHEMGHSLRAEPLETPEDYPGAYQDLQGLGDVPGEIAEGSGIMGGSLGPDSRRLRRFNYLVPGQLNRNRISRQDKMYTLEGDNFTGSSIPPYAAMDVYTLSDTEAALGEFVMDVMANDFDANGNTIELVDCEVVSARGCRVRCANGLVYYTVNPDLIGLDYFHYTIKDSEGMPSKGVVNIDLRNSYTFYEAETNMYSGILDGVSRSSSGGESIHLTTATNWVEFSINVKEEGLYTLKLRYASHPGELLNVDIDGSRVAQTMLHEMDWGRQCYYNLCTRSLTKGSHTVKVYPGDVDFNGTKKDGIRIDALMVEQGVDIKISFHPVQHNTKDDRGNTTHEYLPDNGFAYSNKDAGLKYGWDTDYSDRVGYTWKLGKVSFLADLPATIDGLFTAQVQTDTFIKVPSNAVWKIELPNREYHVQLFAGIIDGRNDFEIGGIRVLDDTAIVADYREGPMDLGAVNLFEQKVTVTNGYLTIKAANSAVTPSLSYLTITDIGPLNTAPIVTSKILAPINQGETSQKNLWSLTIDETPDAELRFSLVETTSALGNPIELTEDRHRAKLIGNVSGSDSYQYVAKDLQGLSSTGTLWVTIIPTNTAPAIPNDGEIETTGGTTGREDLWSLVIDAETEDADLDFALVSNFSDQGHALNLDGHQVEITPPVSFFGEDSFTYTVTDEGGLSATGTVSVMVAVADSDGDGLGDAIEQQIIDADPDDEFTDFASVLPDDDFDGDGASNLHEQIAGTSATDSQSVFSISNLAKRNDGFSISWYSVDGHSYTIHKSTNLRDGFSELKPDIAADAPVNTHIDFTSNPTAMYMITID